MKRVIIALAVLFCAFVFYNLFIKGHDAKYDYMYKPPDELKNRTIDDVDDYNATINPGLNVVLYSDCVDHLKQTGKVNAGESVTVKRHCGDYVYIKSNSSSAEGWCSESFIKKNLVSSPLKPPQ